MHLTKEEERVYEGEEGWARKIAMEILVKLGDLYGAERLIPIESAHISGVSYKTSGEALIKFLETLVESGGRVSTHTTLNPSSFDPSQPEKIRAPEKSHQRQMHIIQLYQTLGIEATLTCTPYYLEAPMTDAHLAWAESSAVIYANSVLDAWTNREGGPSALASAIVGKTPDHGMHRPENREPNLTVEVQAELRSEADYGVLGALVGKIAGDRIPLFLGLRRPSEAQLKQLGAALASTGMVAMYRWLAERRTAGEIPRERIQVDWEELKNTRECLCTTSEKPDLIYIGCPHLSLREIKMVAKLLRGKRVKPDTKFWVCTSRYVKDRASKAVQIIEAAGAQVLAGTCAVVSWLRETGINTVMTNSAKAAHYLPTLGKVEVMIADLKTCTKTACE